MPKRRMTPKRKWQIMQWQMAGVKAYQRNRHTPFPGNPQTPITWRLHKANVSNNGKIPRSRYNGAVIQRQRNALQGRAVRSYPRLSKPTTIPKAVKNAAAYDKWITSMYSKGALGDRFITRRFAIANAKWRKDMGDFIADNYPLTIPKLPLDK